MRKWSPFTDELVSIMQTLSGRGLQVNSIAFVAAVLATESSGLAVVMANKCVDIRALQAELEGLQAKPGGGEYSREFRDTVELAIGLHQPTRASHEKDPIPVNSILKAMILDAESLGGQLLRSFAVGVDCLQQ